jgi:hypothetical protein
VLRAVQDWRRVTALACMCTARGAPCRKDEVNFCRPMRSWTFVASAWQKIQPVQARRAFKKVVSYRLIAPIFPRLVLSPPLSFATAVAHGSSSWFG